MIIQTDNEKAMFVITMLDITVWPNGSYSEKMPRHSGPYWVVVWTLPITSTPRAKCSTWKLGQNGLIWPFLRSFWLYHGIRGFFFVWLDFFSLKLMPTGILSPMDTCQAKARKKSGQIDLVWPDLRPKIHFKEWKDEKTFSQAFLLWNCYVRL